MKTLFRKTDTKTIIAEIHDTFNSAGDKLLNEANKILSDIQNEEKAKRLERAGFVNSVEVKKWNDVKVTKELADLIQYYQMNYPNNKFITEEQVRLINKKYNLVCAPIDRYKGFVPETKLAMIEKFELKKKDNCQMFITNVKFMYPYADSKQIRKLKKKYRNGIYPVSLITNYSLLVDDVHVKKGDIIKNNKLQICAPSKDMDLKGLKKIGTIFQNITTIAVPDPVVLMPCKGGYLIVTAWGDEASDEIIVNQKMN